MRMLYGTLTLILFLSACGRQVASPNKTNITGASDKNELVSSPDSALVISSDSTVAFSSVISEGTYGSSCIGGYGPLYTVRIYNGQYWNSRRLYIYFSFDIIPQLNRPYQLAPVPNVGNSPIENSAGIKMSSEIFSSPFLDVLTSGVITVQKISSTKVTFSFSMSYENGKVLSGTVDQVLIPAVQRSCK